MFSANLYDKLPRELQKRLLTVPSHDEWGLIAYLL